MSTLVTYKIVSDLDGRLKTAARTACNFWNRFIQPERSVVIRLGVFTSFGTTIARAYKPYRKANVVYGVIEFNTTFLKEYSNDQVAGTVAHELGHTLGFGWDTWMGLFDTASGKFGATQIGMLPGLATMLVETDYGSGTTLSHWDEEGFGAELMTGFKNDKEYVLPVTIDVMRLLGHGIIERLEKKTFLDPLLRAVADLQFSQKAEAKALDLDYFEQTPIWEETYDHGRRKSARQA